MPDQCNAAEGTSRKDETEDGSTDDSCGESPTEAYSLGGRSRAERALLLTGDAIRSLVRVSSRASEELIGQKKTKKKKNKRKRERCSPKNTRNTSKRRYKR